MKTLTNHTIIYDDECPMCNQYTKAFIKTGMLDQEGRVAYSRAISDQSAHVDWDRARNEIALINKNDNSVIYGVESLTTIFQQRFPWFKPLFASSIFLLIMRYIYAFISYNRKVIAPSKVFEARNSCTPDQNYIARWAYIIFAWLVTSYILVNYSGLLIPLVEESNFIREFMICGGQIVFQGVIVLLVKRDRWIHYLGNVMTISLVGALALLPMLILETWVVNSGLYLGYFMLIVSLMLFEHVKRVKMLELPWYISATWVLYRLLVLAIIL